MKPLAWAAAIAIVVDTLLSAGRQVYFILTRDSGNIDWNLFSQISSLTLTAHLIMGGLLAAFLILFTSRLKRGAARTSALRLLMICGAVLVIADFLLNVANLMGVSSLMMDGDSVAPNDVWKAVTFNALYLVTDLMFVVLGATSLVLATSSSGFSRVAGILAFVASIVVALGVIVLDALELVRALGVRAPESLTNPVGEVWFYARWSVQVFWLLFAALIASIAVRIRNV